MDKSPQVSWAGLLACFEECLTPPFFPHTPGEAGFVEQPVGFNRVCHEVEHWTDFAPGCSGADWLGLGNCLWQPPDGRASDQKS